MKFSAQQWMGVSDSHIVKMQHNHGLISKVKDAFEAMQAAAAKDGIDLQLVSSFRSFERQLAIWQSKWLGQKPILDIHGQALDIDELEDIQKIHGIMTWSALPGASRHHWGTDLDVYDKQRVDSCDTPFELVSQEYELGGPCYDLSCWLDEHAQRFEFYRPYHRYNGGVAPEAWHLSYRPIATDIIKQLDINALKMQIASIDIGGKAMILQYLDSLFERYTLNGLEK
ncbi:M15 family metallopeptidase [Aliiglaciecola litoralis]|uniref:M15 family metallopeptidase n=1 Tax=Aliiglaciecola litoralis TaxID=582857 RepID=A0ABP3X1I0_9ALTE